MKAFNFGRNIILSLNAIENRGLVSILEHSPDNAWAQVPGSTDDERAHGDIVRSAGENLPRRHGDTEKSNSNLSWRIQMTTNAVIDKNFLWLHAHRIVSPAEKWIAAYRSTVAKKALFPVRRSLPYENTTPTPRKRSLVCAPVSNSHFSEPSVEAE